MSEENKDVITESSTVTEDTAVSQEVNTDVSDAGLSPKPENLNTQISNEEVDEKGVPYKNRYFEMKRKLEETVESIPKIIDREFTKLNQTKTQTQEPEEYTVGQLEEFAKHNPEHKPWVEEKKAELIAKNAAKAVEKTFEKREQERIQNEKRLATYSKLQSEYPELFVKDQSGRFMGWDNSNPVVREIAVISQDPRIANDPEGLILATELAHYRHLKSTQQLTQKELKTVKAQKKELEKKTFVEGASGKPAQIVKDPVRSSIDQAKSTGNKRDIESAISAYFKKAHLGG